MGFLLQTFQEFSPAMLESNSLFPLPHTPSHVSEFVWVHESEELCWGVSGREMWFSSFHFPLRVSDGEELSRWNPSLTKTTIGLACLSQAQRAPDTGVKKMVRPPYTLQGPAVPSVGCSDTHDYAGWLILPAAMLSAQRKD